MAIERNTQKTKKLSRLYDDSFYESELEPSLESARLTLGHLWKYLQPQSVVDVGCGRGIWLKACAELGSEDLVGLDGHWNHQSRMIDSRIRFKGTDLEQPFLLDQRFDLAMTLEVAEHLKESSADGFVESLTRVSDVVLFGAAFSNQGGTNHINEQPHTYWARKFTERDFVAFDIFRPVLWGDPRVCFWYKQNTFLYARKDSSTHAALRSYGLSVLENLAFMDCVHPDLYALKLSALKHYARESSGAGIGFKSHLVDLLPSFYRAVKRRLM